MISPTGSLEIRSDSEGDGHFLAKRGHRLHHGVDLKVFPGQPIVAPVPCLIVREAYPYAGDTKWRGVELRASGMVIHIYYMVVDEILLGTEVLQGEQIGIAQNISQKYSSAMTPHIHLEIKAINPINLIGL